MQRIRLRSLIGCSLAASMSLLFVSCSGASLYPVKGKVLYKGQPLAKAVVSFSPKGGNPDFKGLPSTGLTEDDGTFTIKTGGREGAPAGEYIVTITCLEEVAAKGGIANGAPEMKDKLGGAYGDQAKSKIFVTVKAGENQLDPFDLK